MNELTITDKIQAYEYLYKVANKQIIPDSALTEQAESFFTKEEFKVEGVPALGIGGRYYVDGSLAGSMERALQIADFLTAEIRKGR